MGLSLMAFSGYTLEELSARAASSEPEIADLLATLDVLVDGRYEAGHPEHERLWVGSSNQRFHYFTERYSPAIERPEPGAPLRTIELRLSPDGRLAADEWRTPFLRRLGR